MSNAKPKASRSTPQRKSLLSKNGNGSTALSPTRPTKKKTIASGMNENGNGKHPSLDERDLLAVLTEVKNGNFSVRMPIDQIGLTGKICDTINDIIDLNEKMMLEFTKAGNTIGKQVIHFTHLYSKQ